MNKQEMQEKAVGGLLDLIVHKLGTAEGAFHAGTAVTVCARLTGSLALRSFNIMTPEMKPGSVVLSEEANDVGQRLTGLVQAVMHQAGCFVNTDDMDNIEEATSELDFQESLHSIQDDAIVHLQSCGYAYLEMAQIGAIATGFLISRCAEGLSPEVGFMTAVYSIIEGVKTVPPPLHESITSQMEIKTPKVTQTKTTKKWYKFW